jgi:next-to-BRCA1 protein 1
LTELILTTAFQLRFLLAIPPTSEAIFERYSDSAASFVVLDPNNTSVYKQLYRAAKAKLKLRLKVTVISVKDKEPVIPKPATVEDEEPTPNEQPASPTFVSPPPAPAAAPEPIATVPYVQKPIYPGSVAEIQRGFEDLLINRPSQASSIPSSCCSQPKRELPSVFQQQERLKMCTRNEIPVTRGSSARDKWFAELAGAHRQPSIRTNNGFPAPSPVNIFSVYCNSCEAAIPDEHYHCSTCDDGDYDLCQKCVLGGVTCKADDHWMIKRFVKNGKVINSTTETLSPKPKVPAAESKTTLVAPPEEDHTATRTCNSCILELSEENFVTCTSCEDFDLCISCHVDNKHGHHPKHGFTPAVEDTNLDTVAQALLAPGRNNGHNAICDGCDKVSLIVHSITKLS